MKLLLLCLALLGAAAANHFPGHVEYLTRHADFPGVLSEAIVDQPVMVVTQTTRLAPEMTAILVEHGINNMPENLESFHDVMRIGGEEYTLCNAGLSGDVEVCMRQPITKLLVPEIYKDMTLSRILGEMHMPWVRMPHFRSLPASMSELEFFDRPVLITRTIPVAHETFVAEEPAFKSLHNVPLTKSIYTTKYITDDSFLKSFKPHHLGKSFFYTNPLVRSYALPKFAGEEVVDSEISPFSYKFFGEPHFKSLNSHFYNVKSIKPIVKTEEVIAEPVVKSFDTAVYEKPFYKTFIDKPFIKSYGYDEVITKPFFKNYDEVAERPFFKNYYDDAPTFTKPFVGVKPFYKNYGVDTPAIVPFTKSSSYLLPKLAENLY